MGTWNSFYSWKNIFPISTIGAYIILGVFLPKHFYENKPGSHWYRKGWLIPRPLPAVRSPLHSCLPDRGGELKLHFLWCTVTYREQSSEPLDDFSDSTRDHFRQVTGLDNADLHSGKAFSRRGNCRVAFSGLHDAGGQAADQNGPIWPENL